VTSALESADVMHVPAPVLKRLCTKIHQRGRTQDDEWIQAAEALWRSGKREMRMVAICMLGEAPQKHMFRLASVWAAESDDVNVLRALATEGIGAWRKADPDRTLMTAGEWAESEAMQAFGLMVLEQSLRDGSIHHLPSVFDLLSGLAGEARGLRWDALRDLLITLAEQSPAETTAYLLEEMATGDARTQRLARVVSESLPAALQSQIRSAI
jgi:hypothetical protein